MLPSLRGETWGLVVNEALHHGIPCVVSDAVGCAPDLITSGITGEVFQAGNSHQLAMRHIAMNRLANVTVIEAAGGERSGTAAFDAGPNQLEGRLTADGNLHVTVVTLDEMIQAGALLDADLMKIDVEGAENLVLHGAQALLVKCHPMIFLATHTSESHYACCKLLNDLDYRLAAIDGSALDATDELVAAFKS